jgi:hypothetical protein
MEKIVNIICTQHWPNLWSSSEVCERKYLLQKINLSRFRPSYHKRPDLFLSSKNISVGSIQKNSHFDLKCQRHIMTQKLNSYFDVKIPFTLHPIPSKITTNKQALTKWQKYLATNIANVKSFYSQQPRCQLPGRARWKRR